MSHFWDGFEKRAGLGSSLAAAGQKVEHGAERVLDYSKMKMPTSTLPNWKKKLQAAGKPVAKAPVPSSGWTP